jgi:uncharacterized protein YbjQ (UPF0145 family)
MRTGVIFGCHSAAKPGIPITATNDVAGCRVMRHLGVVRGPMVRPRSVIGNIGAGIQSLFGGNIKAAAY